MNKKTLKANFKKIYPAGSRLLAVQLDGFTHGVVYDAGTRESKVTIDRFSHCMPEGGWSANASAFFKDIGNAGYQNNAQEFIFVLPEAR